jgi:hypothetical protein
MKRIGLVLIAVALTVTTVGAQFVGSKNSNKYHTKECRWAKRISPANLVTFKTVKEALDGGYVPCRVCSPPSDLNKDSVAPAKKGVRQSTSTPLGDGRCEAITKKGTRCSRRAQPGSRFCWQHQGK